MSNEERLDRADAAFESGDFRAAIIDAKDVLRDEPNNLRGRLLLARASLQVGDGAAAEKEIRRAIELGAVAVAEELAQALLLQGEFQAVLNQVSLDGLHADDDETAIQRIHAEAYLGIGEPGMARELFSRVLDRVPDDLNAQLGVVSTYVAERNLAQARSVLDQILQTHGDASSVWLYSGSLSGRLGDFETAGAHFRRALERADAEANTVARLQSLGGIAETELELGRMSEARDIVAQLNAEAPESLHTKLLIARIAFSDKDWKTAQQNLQQILQFVPEHEPAKVLLAAVHLQSGSLSQAEMYLTSVLATSPENVRARQLLAETQLQMRRVDDAQAALAPLLTAENPDPVSLQMAARVSLGQQDVDGAISYLRRSVLENPGDADLRFQLAAILIDAGREEEARTVLDGIDVAGSEDDAYRREAMNVMLALRNGRNLVALQDARRIVASYDGRAGAHQLLGVVQIASQQLPEARQSFQRAVELDPDDVIAYRYLAEVERLAGDDDAASARYEEILARWPDADWAAYSLGSIAFQKENYGEAAEQFQAALDRRPENPNYRVSLARALDKAGDPDAALRLLEDNIGATMQHVQSGVALAALRAERGDADGALELAERLQSAHADNPIPYALEAELRFIDGDIAAANEAYDAALSLGLVRNHVIRAHMIKRQLPDAEQDRPLLDYLEARPLDAGVRMLLAESYSRADDLDKSISAYEQVVSADPGNAVALNNLAWYYHQKGDARALETARRAYDAMPDNSAIADTLGWILVQEGQVAEGERMLRRAVDLGDGRAEIRYHHAVALAKLGETDSARRVLSELLSSDDAFPGRGDAEKLMAEL